MAAEAAGVAEAAAAVAAVAVAAACPGELAGSAKADRFPVTLTDTDRYWPGSTRSTRPIHVFFAVQAATTRWCDRA